MDSDDELLLSPAKVLQSAAATAAAGVLGRKPISPFVWDSDDDDETCSTRDNDAELPDPLAVLRDTSLNDGSRSISKTPSPSRSDDNSTPKQLAAPFRSALSYSNEETLKFRPRSTRPASKKAMQEMHKETQRIERGLALQPAAITTRQIKMEDVLSKFGYRKSTDVPQSVPEVQTLPMEPTPTESTANQLRRIYVPSAHISESDSELDILPPASLESKHNRLAHIVGNAKDGESARSHLTLLRLSGITSPERLRLSKRRLGRTSIQTVKDPKLLSFELIARASIQAQQLRASKREELRNRGIQVMTADERAKEQMDIEDMVERERERDMKLRQEEKALAKKQNGNMSLGNSSEDDSAYSEGDNDSEGASSENSGDVNDEGLDIDLTGAIGASDSVPVVQMETFPFDLESNSHPLQELSESEDVGSERQSIRQASFPRRPRIVSSDDDGDDMQDRVPDSQALPQQISIVGGLTQYFQSTLQPVNQDAPTQLIFAAPTDFSQPSTATEYRVPTSFPTLLPDTNSQVSTGVDAEATAKHGRLKRKVDDPPVQSAFAALAEGQKQERERVRSRPIDKTKAGEFVEEQAEESEDEYAGLGGNSDEDEEDNINTDKELQAMIDNTASVGMDDAKQLAKFHQENQIAQDKADVEKMLQEVTGGFRKRGAHVFDLDDSDDEAEMAARRRRQNELARQRLLADESVSKMVDNPKAKAFLDTLDYNQHSRANFLESEGIVIEEQSEQFNGSLTEISDKEDIEIEIEERELHMPPPPKRADSNAKTLSDIRNETKDTQIIVGSDTDDENDSNLLDFVFVDRIAANRAKHQESLSVSGMAFGNQDRSMHMSKLGSISGGDKVRKPSKKASIHLLSHTSRKTNTVTYGMRAESSIFKKKVTGPKYSKNSDVIRTSYTTVT